MNKLNVFITEKELKELEVDQSLSCCTFGGPSFKSIGTPGEIVEELRIKYDMPEGTGLNLKTGEFCSP